MEFPGFVAGSYESRSVVADVQRTINLYPEAVESGTGKSKAALYRTPGLALFTTLGASPVRCLLETVGRVFAVAGAGLYEIFSDGTSSPRGSVSALGYASMASNGLQLAIASGGTLYCYDLVTNALTTITTIGASWVTYSDSYFIAVKPSSQVIYVSGNLNGLTWDLLDFASAEAAPDNLVQVMADHREVWLFGATSIQPHYNSGAADFPFEPIGGSLIECGAIAGTVAKLDNSIFWTGIDERGAGVVWRADGFRPVRVSTHAIEHDLQAFSDLASASAWSYQDQGHTFYCLRVPSATSTFVYDVSTGTWHERAWWNSATSAYEDHRAACHCYAFGKHLVGDRVNGKVYNQSIAYYTDAGELIRWMRRAPHLALENKRNYYHSFELDMETGGGAAGTVVMRYSNDGGRNWSSELYTTSSGAIGETTKRVRWSRLGSGRDRVFEVYGTDAVNIAIINAYLEITPGNH